MTYDPHNLFARIISGQIPCNKVYEDEVTFDFHDIAPKAPVHVLVVPKGPYKDFESFVQEAPSETVSRFFHTVAQIAQQVGVADAGYRLLTNKGAHAHQEVPHFHVHVVGGGSLAHW